jgi:hypothetical protein
MEVNFDQSPYTGEMLPYERYKLYNWIIDIKPKIIFEVGTGHGGGSTYYIAEAIKHLNNGGKIYTCDPERTIESTLLQDFPLIQFFPIYSEDMLKNLTEQGLKPDFIMFDGPEDPNIAFNDIKYMENFIDDGTHFSMHDWDLYRPYDGHQSTKSVKIREYMENSDNWVLLEQLYSDRKNSTNNMQYDSVGLCLYKYKR